MLSKLITGQDSFIVEVHVNWSDLSLASNTRLSELQPAIQKLFNDACKENTLVSRVGDLDDTATIQFFEVLYSYYFKRKAYIEKLKFEKVNRETNYNSAELSTYWRDVLQGKEDQ